MCKFAHTTSEKVLVDLRTSIRGAEFNQTQLTQTFNQTELLICVHWLINLKSSMTNNSHPSKLLK